MNHVSRHSLLHDPLQTGAELTLAKVHVSINLKVPLGTTVGRVLWNYQAVSGSGSPGLAEESVGFDEHLVVGAALDGLVAVVDVEVVVDVLVAEATGGATSTAVALWEKNVSKVS